MQQLHPKRPLIACLGACLLAATAACSSSPGNSTPDGSGNGGHGVTEEDAATGVAAAHSQGTGGSAGRGGKTNAGSGGELGIPDDGSPGTNPMGGSSSGEMDASGGGSTTPKGGGAAGTCNAIVSCVQACPDDTCAQGCADKGSPAAQELFNALLDCLDLNGCSDGPCLQMYCASEADACTSDGPSSGGLDGGPPPTGGGALPADLVGNWATSDQSTTYQFKADGTYSYEFAYGSSLACIVYLSQRITETGNASVQGDTLTTMGTSRTTATQDCSYKSSTQTDSGKTQAFRYTLSGGTLSLTDSKGNTSTYTPQ
jgi:hypothetical protein